MSTPNDTDRTPRWVKVSGIVAFLIVVLFVILLVAGPGEHGPGRHGASGDLDAAGVGVLRPSVAARQP